MKVEYSSNNSGGSFWLSDNDWYSLAEAGWDVEWAADMEGRIIKPDKNGRYMGSLATSATREGLSLHDAIAEFEAVTNQNPRALGCYSCCGPPHYFTSYDDNGTYLESYSPSAPMYGDDY
jgi:hypothetical protein